MNAFYNTVNDFSKKCNTSEILVFFAIGHVIIGVAQWRNFWVKDRVEDSTISKRETSIKLTSHYSP